jgi:hypothetical protein
MRTFRVFVFGMLLVSGLAALAPGASASVPAVSKTCRSLNPLNQNLEQAIASGNSGKFDSGAIDNLSKSFRKAAKTAPKILKSAMNTIADVAANVARAGSTAAAAAALTKGGQKFSLALVTWSTYLAKNCSGSSPSTT